MPRNPVELNGRQRAIIERLRTQAAEVAATQKQLDSLMSRRDRTIRTGAANGIPVTQLGVAAQVSQAMAYRIARPEDD